MGLLALIPLKVWLVGGAIAAAITLYKCQIYDAENRGGAKVIHKLQEKEAKAEKKAIKAAQKFDKKIVEKKAQERELRKIDNRKEPEKFNKEAFKLLGR